MITTKINSLRYMRTIIKRQARFSLSFMRIQHTAIAIAEAVIKEIYPDEVYQVINVSSYPKALYYEAENCWEVWLYLANSRLNAKKVYVDINTGAVRAIIPSTEF